MKGKKHSKESKLKMSISRIGKIPWNKGKTNIYSEETKERISNSLKEKYKDTIHPNWRGGSIKYCLKFDNECRENNRNKFYNKCFLCGKTEIKNGRKLSVHHVDYNKNQGCNSD